jgi:hypothetical protein
MTDPDATLDVYYAAMACVRSWLHQLVGDLERVNGPVSAQLLVDDLKARLAELERAGAAWLAISTPSRLPAAVLRGKSLQPFLRVGKLNP